jgi:hypothetical protein
MFGGALTTGLGVGLALAFKSPLEEANKFAKLQNDILNNGAKLAQLKGITDWANNDKSIRNLSVNEKMNVAGEAFALTRDAGRDDVHHTLKLAPILAAIEAIAKNGGKEMSNNDKAAFTKILELGGAFNNGADTAAFADRIYKLQASGNGTLTSSVLLSIMKADPNDLQKMSPAAMARSEPLMQEMNSGFGVGLRMINNRLQAHVGFGGGTGGKIYAKLKGMGVFGEDDKVIDSGLLVSDYDMWIRKHLPEFYRAANAKTDAERRQVDQQIFGTSGAKVAGAVMRQSEQMDASEAAVGNQHGIAQSLKEKGGPLDQQMAVLSAKWHDLMLRIGVAVLPMAIKGLSKLTDIMESVADFAKAHPRLVKVVAIAGALFAAFLIIGGALSLTLGIVGTLAGAVGIGAGAGLIGALGGAALAIGVVVGALAVLAAAAYAFSPLSQKEIDDVKTDGGVTLTPNAQARIDGGALDSPYKKHTGGSGVVGPTIKTAAQSSAGGKAGDVYLDGKKVGSIVGEHLARGASMPLGSGMFDTGLTQTVPGLN